MEEEEGEAPEGFEYNEEDFLEVKIDNVSVSNLGFIVFLKAEDPDVSPGKVLPIFIGANEAHSIAIAYNNQAPPRPLTHDLMKNVLGMLDCEVVKVQVTSLSDNTFFGRVHLRKEGIEDMDVDARPSDALALALRYKAPIFVHKDVYASAAIQMKDGAMGEAEAESPHKEPEKKAPENSVQRLKEELEKAIAGEHYEEAARLRDQLKRLQSGN